jgi:hypothetical protein
LYIFLETSLRRHSSYTISEPSQKWHSTDQEVAHGVGEVEEELIWVLHLVVVGEEVALEAEEENQYLTVQE